ncbi:MAG TPA: adenylate/guanylate cyclase domain-containing protein [Desulfuromonadales bacterium]|nr:adenylate/guanylate cyclase domain-containing protein [Desulfuromonadales bacterium]
MTRFVHALIISILVVTFIRLTEQVWQPAEMRLYDRAARLAATLPRSAPSASGNVVLVTIDEKKQMKDKPILAYYPDIGRFIGMMGNWKAKVIALDIIPVHSLGDTLGSALAHSRHAGILTEIGEEADRSLLSPLIEVSRETAVVQGISGTILPFYYFLISHTPAIKPSSVRLLKDRDQVVRSAWLTEPGQQNLPDQSFAMSAYQLMTGHSAPLSRALIDFSLAGGIPQYDFNDVLTNKIPPEKFSGKLVILGSAGSHDDLHATPLGMINGVNIHATIVENLLGGLPMRPAPLSLVYLLALVCCYATALLGEKFTLGSGAGAASLLITAAAAALLLSYRNGWYLQFIPVCGGIALTFGSVYSYRYTVVERQRRELKRTFGYYVDTDVLDALVTAGRLEGEYREMSVLFLDVRDFTRLSRTITAMEIVQFLNILFDRITGVVKAHGGFVNKFLGDGVLAFFCTGDDHADQAVQSAHGMLQAVAELNGDQDFSRLIGEWQVRVGIGIHSGTVAMGTIGSKQKMDFTIIGDPVNMASRIQERTKEPGAPQILFSRQVAEQIQQLGDRGVPLFHEIVQIRGTDNETELYTM